MADNITILPSSKYSPDIMLRTLMNKAKGMSDIAVIYTIDDAIYIEFSDGLDIKTMCYYSKVFDKAISEEIWGDDLDE